MNLILQLIFHNKIYKFHNNLLTNKTLKSIINKNKYEGEFMFFKSKNISLDIISVLSLKWESQNAKSGLRPFHALSYRIKGDTKFITKENELCVESNELTFVPANLQYTMQASNENLIVIHFLSDSVLPNKIKKFSPKNPAYFERKFCDLHTVWSKKHFGYEYECKSIIYKIISKIESEAAESKPKSKIEQITEAVEYIHEHFTENITIEFLAKLSMMSDTYFRKIFFQSLGTTPLKYINKLKLEYAKELLCSDYYTVEEVSEKCGFENINYFSTFIKKQTGVSPSQISKQKML